MIESFQRTVICHVREKLPPLGLCCGLVWEVVTLCHLGSQLPRSPGDAASSTELCDARFQACSDSSSLSAPSAAPACTGADSGQGQGSHVFLLLHVSPWNPCGSGHPVQPQAGVGQGLLSQLRPGF